MTDSRIDDGPVLMQLPNAICIVGPPSFVAVHFMVS